MAATERAHRRCLFKVGGLSTNEPTQTLPKSPLSAMTGLSLEVCPWSDTVTVCGPAGSLPIMVTFAGFGPGLVGSKRITTSRELFESTPGARKSGRRRDDVRYGKRPGTRYGRNSERARSLRRLGLQAYENKATASAIERNIWGNSGRVPSE